MMVSRSSLDHKRRRRRVLWLVLAALAVAALVLAFVWGAPRPEVEAVAVSRGPYVRDLEEDGRARIRDRYVVSAPLAGTLRRLALRAGDPVAAGQVVAVVQPATSALLDARSRTELAERLGAAQARLRSTEAARARVAAAHARAERERDRVRELARSGAVTARDLDLAESELAIVTHERDGLAHEVHLAEHEVAQARAALGTGAGAAAPAGFELRAPIAGRVLRLVQESETVVAPGTPIVELGDPAALEIVVDLLSTDAVHVQPGLEVELTGWGGERPLRGRVRTVQPVAAIRVSALGVEEERVDVIVDPVEEDPRWARVGDGYRVDVRIPLERVEGALRVPTGALFREGDAWRVFVVDAGVARGRTVTVASYGPRLSRITEGVAEGEAVVVQPPPSLREGTKVEVRAVAADGP